MASSSTMTTTRTPAKMQVIERNPMGKWVRWIVNHKSYMSHTGPITYMSYPARLSIVTWDSEHKPCTKGHRAEQISDLKAVGIYPDPNFWKGKKFNFLAAPDNVKNLILEYAGIVDEPFIFLDPFFLHKIEHHDWKGRNMHLSDLFHEGPDYSEDCQPDYPPRMFRGDMWIGAPHWHTGNYTVHLGDFSERRSELEGWPFRHLSEDNFRADPMRDLRLPLDNLRYLTLTARTLDGHDFRHTLMFLREMRSLREVTFDKGSKYWLKKISVPAPERLIRMLNEHNAFHPAVPLLENGDKAVKVFVRNSFEADDVRWNQEFDDLIDRIAFPAPILEPVSDDECDWGTEKHL